MANKLLKKYGPWAVVTGASSGIGKEFARVLAENGFSLVLVARRKDRLEELATELHKEHKTETLVVRSDLSKINSPQLIYEATKGLDVGLLINNAGVERHGTFLTSNIDSEEQLMRINMNAPMQLSYLFGQDMTDKGRGGVLFTSSVVATQGVGYFGNYSASKAYILSLAEALNFEFKERGVDVSVVLPGPTQTEMVTNVADELDMSNLPMRFLTARRVAEEGLRGLGRLTSIIPGKRNRVITFFGRHFFSRSLMSKQMGGMFKVSVSKASTSV